MKFEYLKFYILIFSRKKRDFRVKIFFLVSQEVSFRLKKQTSKNVVDITFKVERQGVLSPPDNFLSEVSLNTGKLPNTSCLDILEIISRYNRGFKLLDAWVSQHFAFLPKVEESIRGTPIKEFIECLIVPTFIVLSLVGLFLSIIKTQALIKNYFRFGNRHFGGSKLFDAWICQ